MKLITLERRVRQGGFGSVTTKIVRNYAVVDEVHVFASVLNGDDNFIAIGESFYVRREDVVFVSVQDIDIANITAEELRTMLEVREVYSEEWTKDELP